MQVRVLDYRGEQDVWATIAEPDGKLAQVKLKDGQFTIVAELWDGAEQVEIAQHLTNDGEESGYLECAEEGEEAPCGWHVTAAALGFYPHKGQRGYIASWSQDGYPTKRRVVQTKRRGFAESISWTAS